jgi:hypothetical protein
MVWFLILTISRSGLILETMRYDLMMYSQAFWRTFQWIYPLIKEPRETVVLWKYLVTECSLCYRQGAASGLGVIIHCTGRLSGIQW